MDLNRNEDTEITISKTKTLADWIAGGNFSDEVLAAIPVMTISSKFDYFGDQYIVTEADEDWFQAIDITKMDEYLKVLNDEEAADGDEYDTQWSILVERHEGHGVTYTGSGYIR